MPLLAAAKSAISSNLAPRRPARFHSIIDLLLISDAAVVVELEKKHLKISAIKFR